jgi:hypothetical protein
VLNLDVFALSDEIERRYAEDDDVSFDEFLDRCPPDDEAIAHLIHVDGMHRLRRGLPLTIDRYHVETLGEDALRAAISWMLRSTCDGRVTDSAVSDLADLYPAMASRISEARELANCWMSTGVMGYYGRRSRILPVLSEFGPTCPDGTRRYQVRRLIGSGASGDVYEAKDHLLSDPDGPPSADALVAIKVLDPFGRGMLEREMMFDEARRARRVNHPHVVKVLDMGWTDDGRTYIVYERVPSIDMRMWVRDTVPAMTVREVVRLVITLADGVQSIHSAGLVHRDLKPDNLIISPDGDLKIADFGLSSPVQDTETTQMRVGNLVFMSPEQFRCEPGGRRLWPIFMRSVGCSTTS